MLFFVGTTLYYVILTRILVRTDLCFYQLLSVIQGMFLLSGIWARVLFDSGPSHSFIVASFVLDLKVQSLEKLLHVSFPLGTRVRIH